jgi:hypothetical protein
MSDPRAATIIPTRANTNARQPLQRSIARIPTSELPTIIPTRTNANARQPLQRSVARIPTSEMTRGGRRRRPMHRRKTRRNQRRNCRR